MGVSLKKNVYFADFETLTYGSNDYNKLGHTDIYMWCILESKDKYWLGTDLDSFFQTILKDLTNYNIIYFHNLPFDGNFIIKWLFRNKFFFIKEGKIKKNSKCFTLFNKGKNIYKIEVNWKLHSRRVRVIFQCSLKILSSSIKQLGRQFGFNKMEASEELIEMGIIKNEEEFYHKGGFNMDPVFKEKMEKYIIQDCLIAKMSFDSFVENIRNSGLLYSKKFKNDAFNIYKKMTAGAISYHLSKNFIYQQNNHWYPKYFIKAKDYMLSKKWFSGGFTQFNPKYHDKLLKNIDGLVLDINSSYPFSMTKLLPLGALEERRNPLWKHHLEFYEIHVKEAWIKNKYWNFVILRNWKKEGIQMGERYCRRLNNFVCYYSKEEWEFINKIYYFEIKKIKKYYCEADYILKDFVEKLYYYKENSKSAGEKLTWKIMLNSLFGKQATRLEFEAELVVDKETYDKYNLKDKIFFKEEARYVSRKGQDNFFFQKDLYTLGTLLLENNKEKCSNILIAAMITSYSRLMLWEAIDKVGISNWLYGDTDSIFIKNWKEEDIKNILEVDSKKLGAWDIEAHIKSGKILGAKRYGFLTENGKIKLAFSGVNKTYDDIDWSEKYIDALLSDGVILDKAQLSKQEDEYGYVLIWKNLEIKKGDL